MKTCIVFLLFFIFNLSFANTFVVPKVQVDAKPSQQSNQPTNAHTRIISAKEIQNSAAENITEILEGLVGVQVNDLTGNGSQLSVSMRGFGSNAAENSLILVNGMPLVNPDLATPNLNSIPVQDIQKIEVFNGSQGVLFGEQAVGGVINIITKKPEKNSMYASTSAGSYNTQIYREGFSILGPNNLYSSVNVEKYKTNNYRDHNSDNNEQLFGNICQNNANSGWNLYYNLYHQILDYAGALTAAQVASNSRQAQNNINFSNNNYRYIQFQQHHDLWHSWQEDFKFSNRQLRANGILFNPFNSLQKVNWMQLQLKGLIGNAFVTNGVMYQKDSYDLKNGSYLIADKQHQMALFSLAQIPFAKKWSLIVGARGAWQEDHLLTTSTNDSHPSAFVTTLGLSYQWNKWLSFFARRAGNYRFPKADEQAATAMGMGGLKTQKGVSYELGAKFNKARWYGTVSVFDLLLRNEIAFDPTSTPNNPFGTNRNLDPTQRLGALLNLNYQITHNLILGGQYSHINATFRKGLYQGNEIPFVAENTASIYSNYNFLPHWGVFAKLIFVGSRFATGDDANAFPKVPALTLLNMALHYHYQDFFASFRVNNVFNHRYNAFTSLNTISIMPLTKQLAFYPAPGRNYLLTIGFKLS